MAAPSLSNLSQRQRDKKLRLRFENRIWITALAAGFSGILATLILLFIKDYSTETRWVVSTLVVVIWMAFAFSVREQVMRPLQTLSNLIEALRDGDFSLRAHEAGRRDALGDVMHEINALSENLRQQRFATRDVSALLSKV